MLDREKVIKAFEYLNWHFTQDDEMADKDAVKAWNCIWIMYKENDMHYCSKYGKVVKWK